MAKKAKTKQKKSQTKVQNSSKKKVNTAIIVVMGHNGSMPQEMSMCNQTKTKKRSGKNG